MVTGDLHCLWNRVYCRGEGSSFNHIHKEGAQENMFTAMQKGQAKQVLG